MRITFDRKDSNFIPILRKYGSVRNVKPFENHAEMMSIIFYLPDCTTYSGKAQIDIIRQNREAERIVNLFGKYITGSYTREII
jgi:hypothetical protein